MRNQTNLQPRAAAGEAYSHAVSDEKHHKYPYSSPPASKSAPLHKLGPDLHRARRRRGELIRLAQFRSEHNVPWPDLQGLALVLVDAMSFAVEVDYYRVAEMLDRMAIRIPETTIMAAIHRVYRWRERKGAQYRLIYPTVAGRALGMTCEERIFSGIRTMNAIDERPAERKARADGDRRSRDAAWHRQHRGRKPRAIYEAESLSAEKPWVAEGISRASWYRRRSAQSSHNSSAGQDDITSAAFSDETGVSSLIYIDLRRCDDTPVSRSS